MMEPSPAFAMLKRILDISLSAIGLVLLFPAIAILAILVKLDSRGPAFYRGVRAGRFGKPFRIFKLRTMVVNADKLGGAETPADDPRITRIGSFLRHYKLDEFPQLINVLLGDMSLVGPRPEVMEEVENYNDSERGLLRVRPGITDWASIKFRHEGEILRGSSDPHRSYHELIRPEKIRLGLTYVNNHSVLDDIKILFQTLKVIFD
jgi:lipopolysaccharide/colanic/teichoic acid biosynthesis glycosyltransferase